MHTKYLPAWQEVLEESLKEKPSKVHIGGSPGGVSTFKNILIQGQKESADSIQGSLLGD